MITTVTKITALGLEATTSVALVVILIVFLVSRELGGVGSHNVHLRISRFVTVGILPLVLVFVVILVMKIIELLI